MTTAATPPAPAPTPSPGTLNVPQDGTYQVFVRYAAGTASNAPFKIDYNGGSVTKPVNQATQMTLHGLPKYPFNSDQR